MGLFNFRLLGSLMCKVGFRFLFLIVIGGSLTFGTTGCADGGSGARPGTPDELGLDASPVGAADAVAPARTADASLLGGSDADAADGAQANDVVADAGQDVSDATEPVDAEQRRDTDSGSRSDAADTVTTVTDLPPQGGASLLEWLSDGEYAEWDAEPEIHPSAGPHFGGVRTFFNPALSTSLVDGAQTHPPGAAAVKELYGGEGEVPVGWAVVAKFPLQPNTWYAYEYYQGSVLVDGFEPGSCTGCHAEGNDYILTVWP